MTKSFSNLITTLSCLFIFCSAGYAQICTCDKNNQDKTLETVYLGDRDGIRLPENYQCTGDETAKVFIWAVFQGNATRYSLYVQYRLLIDNVEVKTFGQCFFYQQAIPTGISVLIDSIEWECGAEVKLADYFMSWQANSNSISCGCNYHGCYGSPVDIIVRAPLFARMTYSSECLPGSVARTYTFLDHSTGGNFYVIGEPYGYLWNFGPPADYRILSGSLSASAVKVEFLSAGNKTAQLTVTDSTLVSKTVTEEIAVGSCLHITTVAKPDTFECSNTAGLLNWFNTHGGATVSGESGAVTWTWSPDPYVLTGGCSAYTGSALITFTATDEASNAATTTAAITIADTRAPVIGTPASSRSVRCDGAGNTESYNLWLTTHAGALASDSCDANPVWSTSGGEWTIICGNSKETTVTFYATDACGNVSSGTTATFIIRDSSAPVITKQAQNMTVDCDGAGNTAALTSWLSNHGGAASTDDCNSVTWSHNFTSLEPLCGATGKAAVIFTATDDCGNKSETSATFTIRDITPPLIVKAAENLDVQCDGKGNPVELQAWLNNHGGAAATEGCSTVTWSHNFTSLTNLCGATGAATVIFTATDACGNTSTTSATFTVLDNTPPMITTKASALTVECDGTGNSADLNAWLGNHGSAVATDACSSVTWSHNFTTLSDLCGATGSVNVVFTATDECGNMQSTSALFTIQDVTTPRLTAQAQNLTVDCDGAGNTGELNAWLTNNGGAVASDACSPVSWSHNFSSLSGLCGATGASTVVFTVSDDCGNKTTTTAAFIIRDITPPQLVTAASDLTVECDGSGNITQLTDWLDSHGGAVASDACSGVTWSHNFTGLSNLCGATGAATVIFTATDACGNKTTTEARFTIKDSTVPVLSAQAGDLTVECDGSGNAAQLTTWLSNHGGALASDACSQITWSHNFTGLSNLCGATGMATVTFIATDDCGNQSAGTSATFKILDTVAPSFSCPQNLTRPADEGKDFATITVKVPAVSDACGTAVLTNSKTGNADAGGQYPLGTTIVIYTATDECGNASSCSFTVSVVDQEAPVLNCPDNISGIECPGDVPPAYAGYNQFVAAGGSAYDNQGINPLSFALVSETSNNASCPEIITRTYYIEDLQGASATCAQSIIINDKIPPQIVCPAPVNVQCADDIPAPGVSGIQASDNCGIPVVSFAGDQSEGSCPLVIRRTYKATDGCGNTSYCTQIITVDDTTPPVISCPAGITVQCTADVPSPNITLVTATDNCSQPVVTFVRDAVSGTCPTIITRMYQAMDDCGNVSTCIQTITVDDTIPPQVSCPAPVTVQCSGSVPAPDIMAVTATDNCGIQSVTFRGDVSAGKCPEIITRSYEATDICGNKTTCTQTITINDTTPPVITCPASVTVQCDSQIPEPDTNAVTASDNCGKPVVTYVGESENGSCPRVITRTYKATDACGNVSTCIQTITVHDTTLPQIACPASVTVQCMDEVPLPDITKITKSDNCGIPVVSFVSDVPSGTCPKIITRTYQAKDGCNNLAVCTQIIRVEDRTAPVFTQLPQDRVVECDGTGNAAQLETWLMSPRASDNCGTVTITHNLGTGPGKVSLSDGCGATGSVKVTWTARDGCGNSIEASAVFTVVDTTPPDFSIAPADTVQADKNCEFNAGPEVTGFPEIVAEDCSPANKLQITYSDVIVQGEKPGEQFITRTWKVVDECGKSAVKEQIILVLGGKAPPNLMLHEICVYLNVYGRWTLNKLDMENMVRGTTANCGATSELSYTFSRKAFNCNDALEGKALVEVTATDSAGDTVTKTGYILVRDTIPPVPVCHDTILFLNEQGRAYVTYDKVNFSKDTTQVLEWGSFYKNSYGGSYDNCGIENIFFDRTLFTCADLAGPKEVFMTVVDKSGNASYCIAEITILDTIKPVISPVADVNLTVAPGVCTTKIPYPSLVVKDNCGVLWERLAGLGPAGMFPLGTTAEKWKAVNTGGTFSEISFSVTVNTYNGPPSIAGIPDVAVNENAAAFEVPLTGIGYGPDCVPQQVLSLDVTNSNTGLLTLEKSYAPGDSTGKLVITPLAGKHGEAFITVTVRDDGGTANGGTDTTVKTFRVTVGAVNDPPEVTPLADQIVVLPGSLAVNLSAAFSDPDPGDVLTFTVKQSDGTLLPSWMTFTAATGLLTGTPSPADQGAVKIKVTATDTGGASAEDEFFVIVTDPGAATIHVKVMNGTVPVTNGISLLLFRKDGTLFIPMTGSPVLTGENFSFYNLPGGTYLAKAIVTDALLHPRLLDTWHESAASVFTATPVVLAAQGVKTIQINMVPLTLITGEYSITGKIIRRTGTPGVTPISGPGTPAEGVTVILKQNGQVVANTSTGTNGTYTFGKLPAGEYDVFVELPGYSQEVTRKVVINATIPVQDKIDFTIWTGDDTHIITRIAEVTDGFDLRLFPNPTTGEVNIDLNRKAFREIEVSVISLRGDVVYRKVFNAGEKINFTLSQQASGIYMVRVVAEDQLTIHKLVLDRR